MYVTVPTRSFIVFTASCFFFASLMEAIEKTAILEAEWKEREWPTLCYTAILGSPVGLELERLDLGSRL